MGVKNPSGFAFPINESSEHGTGNYNVHPGLTKREYFAAAALTGLLAHQVNLRSRDWYAQEAFMLADEMMEFASKT